MKVVLDLTDYEYEALRKHALNTLSSLEHAVIVAMVRNMVMSELIIVAGVATRIGLSTALREQEESRKNEQEEEVRATIEFVIPPALPAPIPAVPQVNPLVAATQKKQERKKILSPKKPKSRPVETGRKDLVFPNKLRNGIATQPYSLLSWAILRHFETPDRWLGWSIDEAISGTGLAYKATDNALRALDKAGWVQRDSKSKLWVFSESARSWIPTHKNLLRQEGIIAGEVEAKG
jgi:hypothetical protein